MSQDKPLAQDKYGRTLALFAKQPENVPLKVFTDPYEVLVSTIMSARTNDDTTLPAANRLFEKAPNSKKLATLPEKQIAELIYPVGFYKTKAKNLKNMAIQLNEVHGGKVPQTLDELTKLSGVGRKTANLVMIRAFGADAISVDTHVHKVSNMLGWVDTKTPEQTERELMKVVPKKYWKDINHLMVSVGRNFKTKKNVEKYLRENGLLT